MKSLHTKIAEAVESARKRLPKAKFDEAYNKMVKLPTSSMEAKLNCINDALKGVSTKESAEPTGEPLWDYLLTESAKPTEVDGQAVGDDGLTESQRSIVKTQMKANPNLTENEIRHLSGYPLKYPEALKGDRALQAEFRFYMKSVHLREADALRMCGVKA